MNTIVQFFHALGGEMLLRTRQHIVLTFLAVVIACALAVPLGVMLARCRSRALVSAIMGVVNIIQPIPSLAMVAFTALLFNVLGLPTMGMAPGLVALVAYGLLPILRNTYTGIRQVDPAVIEVATGMGMTRRQVLFSVQLPLALPVIMAGVRIATVWTIGVATLVSEIGAGGLGDLIFKGLQTFHMDYVLAGAAPAAVLALVLDWVLSLVERWLTPAGARRSPRQITGE